jgi:hypothetical protein
MIKDCGRFARSIKSFASPANMLTTAVMLVG